MNLLPATIDAGAIDEITPKRNYEYLCSVCKIHQDIMYFFPEAPSKVFCLDHQTSDMRGFSAQEPKQDYLLDREGNEIIDILYGKSEETKLGIVTFSSAVQIRKPDGKEFFFCSYDIKEFNEEMAITEGDEI